MEDISKFQRWYNKNKQALNAKRQLKYRTDSTYREKILEYQRSQRKARSQLSPQSQYRETVLGQIVRAYSMGEASQLIRRQAQTIIQWEKRGIIPAPTFPPPRAYTYPQILLVRELVYIITKAYARRISNGKVQAEIATQQAKIFAHWYEIPDKFQN